MKNKHATPSDAASAVLNSDKLFSANYRNARSRFTAGVIPASQFNNIVEWQIGDCFRRKGLPIRQARIMQRAAACRLTSA